MFSYQYPCNQNKHVLLLDCLFGTCAYPIIIGFRQIINLPNVLALRLSYFNIRPSSSTTLPLTHLNLISLGEETKMADNQGEGIKELDPNGDAIIVASHPTKPTMKWRISSAILSMISPYFRAIFSANFREGIAVKNGECPEIELKEDDPDALDILLSIFHHQPEPKHQTLDAKMLAIVAEHCDKYQCSRAPTMHPWAMLWFHNAPKPNESFEYAHLLAAAYMFKLSDYVTRVSIDIIRDVDMDIEKLCAHDELTRMIPQDLQGKLSLPPWLVLGSKLKGYFFLDQIAVITAETVEKIFVQFQMTERRLQSYKELYLSAENDFCPPCKRIVEHGVSSWCRDCMQNTLIALPCTQHSRVGEYLAYLRKANVWPTVESLKRRSVTHIADCVIRAPRLEHRCSGEHRCPLMMEETGLKDTLYHIKSTIPGVTYSFA